VKNGKYKKKENDARILRHYYYLWLSFLLLISIIIINQLQTP